jgi:hypothetical protein
VQVRFTVLSFHILGVQLLALSVAEVYCPSVVANVQIRPVPDHQMSLKYRMGLDLADAGRYCVVVVDDVAAAVVGADAGRYCVVVVVDVAAAVVGAGAGRHCGVVVVVAAAVVAVVVVAATVATFQRYYWYCCRHFVVPRALLM